MEIGRIIDKLGRASLLLSYVGAATLFLMMILVTIDVLGRYLFNCPILGVYEVTELSMVILVYSFLAHTQSRKAHIVVDELILFGHMPERVRFFINILNHSAYLVMMLLFAWTGVKRALEFIDVGQTSMNLKLPYAPFTLFLVLGCLVMGIEYLRDIIRFFIGNGRIRDAEL